MQLNIHREIIEKVMIDKDKVDSHKHEASLSILTSVWGLYILNLKKYKFIF